MLSHQIKEVIKMYKNNVPVKDIAQKVGISTSTLYKIIPAELLRKKGGRPKAQGITVIPTETDVKTDNVIPVSGRKRRRRFVCKNYKNTNIVQSVVDLSYRIEKFEIRKWIIEQANNLLKKIKAITFPGTEWLMERDLLLKCGEKYIRKIVGLEFDNRVYDYAVHNVPPSDKVLYYRKSDADFFSSPCTGDKFNLLWLDYMGPFTFTKLEVFRMALANGHLDDDVLLCLTLLNGRDHQVVKDYEAICDNNLSVGEGRYNQARQIVIPRKYEEVAANFGYKTKVLNTKLYKEEQGRVKKTPMLFIALFLSKTIKNRR